MTSDFLVVLKSISGALLSGDNAYFESNNANFYIKMQPMLSKIKGSTFGLRLRPVTSQLPCVFHLLVLKTNLFYFSSSDLH